MVLGGQPAVHRHATRRAASASFLLFHHQHCSWAAAACIMAAVRCKNFKQMNSPRLRMQLLCFLQPPLLSLSLLLLPVPSLSFHESNLLRPSLCILKRQTVRKSRQVYHALCLCWRVDSVRCLMFSFNTYYKSNFAAIKTTLSYFGRAFSVLIFLSILVITQP